MSYADKLLIDFRGGGGGTSFFPDSTSSKADSSSSACVWTRGASVTTAAGGWAEGADIDLRGFLADITATWGVFALSIGPRAIGLAVRNSPCHNTLFLRLLC